MRRAETAFLLALSAFLAGFCLLGQFYYAYSADLMRFPLLAAGFTLIVIVVRLVDMRSQASIREAQKRAAANAQAVSERRRTVAGLLWLCSILPLIFLLGFPAGLAIYLFAILRHSGEGWAVAFGLAGASLVISYGLFIEVLGISLPLIPTWWPY